ncbi:MAG TPA: YHS domain-containing protein [Bacteroidia bacterium]|jgi:YHS domain-containing protein|nr:YHS domain-containing protein [Bacteroidia bacterium]
MKTNSRFIGFIFATFSFTLFSCTAAKNTEPKTAKDLVCGMDVDKSEAYTSKYKGVNYYFDTYNCKHVFSMDPDKFISNRCVAPDLKK